MKHFLRKNGKEARLISIKSISVFSILVLFLIFNGAAHGQVLDKKINLSAATTTGIKITAAIKAQLPEVRFTYDDVISQKIAGTVKLTISQPTVKQLLDIIKSTFGIEYQTTNNYIILSLPKSPNASAGGGPGTIRGRIVEFETTQPLPGASVYIVELQKGMQSNIDGYYSFTNIPSGKYTVQVSYVSFATEKVVVEVKPGKEATYDIKLQGSNSLKEVVISSVKKSRAPVSHTSERQVLEEVKQASMVVSAISSEQISKSADRNAAEVMQRVSGVTTVDDKFVIVRGLNQRYNLTYLNDNVAPSTELYSRAFALDLIPSRIIDKILVFKSPSPENQGDATGGVVKIYTKDAKNVKHFDIEVQTGLREGTTFKNVLTYQGGKFDFLGFDDGTRKLPSVVPAYGSLQKATISQQQYAKGFSPYLYLGQKQALPTIQITANYYDSYKLFGKPLSMLTSFSYKHEDQQANIYRQQGIDDAIKSTIPNDAITFENNNRESAQLNLLQNFTYRLRDSSNLQFKNFLLQQGVSTTIEKVFHRRAMADQRAFDNKDIVLSYSQRFLYAGNVGGTHYYGGGKHRFDWNGGLTYSSQELPDQRVIRLQAPLTAFTTGDPNLYWFARGRKGDPEDSENQSRINQGMISRTWTRNNEGIYNASLDYTYKFKPWLFLKAGTFQQWKERKVFRRVYTVHEGDFTGTYSDYITAPGGYGTYVDPALTAFKQQDLSRLWSANYLRDDKTGLLVVDNTQGSDAYTATEQNNSGYALMSFTPAHRKFEVYGGVRIEYDRQRVGAAVQPTDQGGINRPVLVNISKLDILPSVNASYRPHDNWVLRAAYGKTVNRPEFTEISPFNDYDLENNTRRQGNPYLRPATASNYDLRLEFYPRKNQYGETISIGAFYKTLQNPIERINASDRILNSPALITFQNAARASIKGVEFELRKNLDFIPGNLFKRLSVIGNLTLIKSEAIKDSADVANEQKDQPDKRIGNFIIKRPLQGQAPYIVNVGLYYDNASTGTKISGIYNIVGTRIYAAGRGFAADPTLNGSQFRGSLMELPRHVVDISVTQRIVKTIQARFSVQNLLNKPIEMAEDYNFTSKYEPVKTVVTDGVTKVEGDNIASRYNPGRHYVLSFSYSF
ncbi:TonB-dependent receptor [Mucilaginibacter gracilis]|uniref:TonB-dependent receptor n=1 Tax=Mucilaginibacter gracilis TaxID=423350 RepID=A0A495J7C1_9SPHI|nr:TonB-dependent receptor [Mucilaginibacter gracilis]RKR84298.1 TonB-dependent receptor [Mucilaginibacter gracilis]